MIEVTLKLDGQPEKLIVLDPAEVALLQGCHGHRINVDGEPRTVSAVHVRLDTVAQKVQARVECR